LLLKDYFHLARIAIPWFCADDSQPKEKNNMAGKKRTTKKPITKKPAWLEAIPQYSEREELLRQALRASRLDVDFLDYDESYLDAVFRSAETVLDIYSGLEA